MIYKPLTPIEPIEIPIINPIYGDFVTVTNQLTKKIATVPVTVSENTYSFSLEDKSFYEVPAQYDYNIFYLDDDSKVTVQTGLLQIGDIENKKTVYSSEINIKTYNG